MKMKGFFLLLLSYLQGNFAIQAQQFAGIYQSAQDFMQQKTTYCIDCQNATDKIKYESIFNSQSLIIRHNDTTLKVSKDSLWGFALCNGKQGDLLHGGIGRYEFPSKIQDFYRSRYTALR